MSAEALSLIGHVRELIGKEDYKGALTLLKGAPPKRDDWTPQEKDEVICLEEFIVNLNDPAFSTTPV